MKSPTTTPDLHSLCGEASLQPVEARLIMTPPCSAFTVLRPGFRASSSRMWYWLYVGSGASARGTCLASQPKITRPGSTAALVRHPGCYQIHDSHARQLPTAELRKNMSSTSNQHARCWIKCTPPAGFVDCTTAKATSPASRHECHRRHRPFRHGL